MCVSSRSGASEANAALPRVSVPMAIEPCEKSGVQDVGVIQYRQVQAEGNRLTGVSMRAEHGTPSFTVVSGRMPSGPREVALGPKTADELGQLIVGLHFPLTPDLSQLPALALVIAFAAIAWRRSTLRPQLQ